MQSVDDCLTHLSRPIAAHHVDIDASDDDEGQGLIIANLIGVLSLHAKKSNGGSVIVDLDRFSHLKRLELQGDCQIQASKSVHLDWLGIRGYDVNLSEHVSTTCLRCSDINLALPLLQRGLRQLTLAECVQGVDALLQLPRTVEVAVSALPDEDHVMLPSPVLAHFVLNRAVTVVGRPLSRWRLAFESLQERYDEGVLERVMRECTAPDAFAFDMSLCSPQDQHKLIRSMLDSEHEDEFNFPWIDLIDSSDFPAAALDLLLAERPSVVR